VRDVPAVVLDRAQAEHMEGAYQAGVRCADESGHVLVVSLPGVPRLCPPPAPVRRDRRAWSRWPRREKIAPLSPPHNINKRT
jgi:hypothetical protein